MAEQTELTARQRAFVDEFLKDRHATRAAVRAGYAAKYANREGSRLLAHPAVQAAIRAATEELSRQAHVYAYQVIRELALVAFADVTAFAFDPRTGEVTAPADSPEVARALAAVKRKVKNTPGGTEVDVEVRLWPKVEALKLLGQHLGLFKDQGEAADGPPYKVYLGFDPREVLCPPPPPPTPPGDLTAPAGPPAG